MSDVILRALEPEDYKVTHKWRLDDATWSAVVGLKRYVSLETERKWVLNAIENHEKGVVLRFVICKKSHSAEALGLISVSSIDNINKSCSISSMISPAARGQGIIGEARLQVFHYLYSQLGMERIWSQILEDNHASRKAVEKFGIVQEGILRRAVYKDGKFQNLVCYSMLRDEFYQLHSKRLGFEI